MNQIMTTKRFPQMEKVLHSLQKGKGVIVLDAYDRENEADLIFLHKISLKNKWDY